MAFPVNEHTKSFCDLEQKMQQIFDFAVVVDYGVATLEQQIQLIQKGVVKSFPRRKYFKKDENSLSLKSRISGFKEKLATYIYLSSFAFFEAYIGSLVNEFLSRASFSRMETDSVLSRINNPNLIPLKRGLNAANSKAKNKNKHLDKYLKFSKKLKDENYIIPHTLIQNIALNNLIKNLDELQANKIPSFIENNFYLKLDEDTVQKFGNYRAIRNEIAHGGSVNLTLSKVSEMNTFFRKLALKIDNHVKEHFFLPINYKAD